MDQMTGIDCIEVVINCVTSYPAQEDKCKGRRVRRFQLDFTAAIFIALLQPPRKSVRFEKGGRKKSFARRNWTHDLRFEERIRYNLAEKKSTNSWTGPWGTQQVTAWEADSWPAHQKTWSRPEKLRFVLWQVRISNPHVSFKTSSKTSWTNSISIIAAASLLGPNFLAVVRLFRAPVSHPPPALLLVVFPRDRFLDPYPFALHSTTWASYQASGS